MPAPQKSSPLQDLKHGQETSERLVGDLIDGKLSPGEIPERLRELATQSPFKLGVRLACYALVVLGAALTLIGTGFAVSSLVSISGSTQVVGNVTRIAGGRSQYVYSVDQKEFTGESWLATEPPAHEEGELVKLFVKNGNPERSRINSFLELWMFPSIFSGAGALMLSISLIILRLVRR